MQKSPLIVLTGPSTEMSDYEGNLVIPFAAGFSKPWFLPRSYLKRTFFKPVLSNSLEVGKAPLGLRRLEAELIRSGFQLQDIAIVHPDDLSRAVGPDTKVIGISTKDPFGLGYVSLTYSSLLDLGEPLNKLEFRRLVKAAEQAKSKYGTKIVVGGPGSWQLLRPESQDLSCLDVVFIGEGDVTGPEVFWRLIQGQELPKVVEGKQVEVRDIPPIVKPSIYGAVEISRGCGRGCAFCSPTMTKRKVIPIDMIVREVELNVSCSVHDVLLVTEDVFMYGCKDSDFVPNREAVGALLDAVTGVSGVESVQVTHANLAAVSVDKMLAGRVAEVLSQKSKYSLRGKRVATVEVGVETGSPRLIGKYMAGKCRPFDPADWPGLVLSSLSFMEEHDWIALSTILVGLPSESDEDVGCTIKLIEDIERMGLSTFLVPLLFVPLGTCGLREAAVRSFDGLSEFQVEVFALAWEHNVRVWGPDFFRSPAFASFWARFGFRLVSGLLYGLKYRWGDRWRRVVAERVLRALRQVV